MSKKLNQTFRSHFELLPVFKALRRAIRNRTRGLSMSSTGSIRGQSTSPIQSISLFLRLHAGTIHVSNLENFLVFKAQRRDDPQVQSQNLVFNAGLETDHVISGPMRRLEKKTYLEWTSDKQTNGQTNRQKC